MSRSGDDLVDFWSHRFRVLALVDMFLVVLIHCTSSFKAENAYVWAFGFPGFCRVAVPFFFLVSGMFLGLHVCERGWWRREVGKRCHTLVVPYFVWLTIFFVYRTVLLSVAGESVDFSLSALAEAFGLNPLTCPGLRPLWYVRALFGLVLVSPVFIWLVRKRVGLLFLLALPFADWTFFPLGLALGMRAINLRLARLQAVCVFAAGVMLMTAGAWCEATYGNAGWLRGLALPFLVIGGINLTPNVSIHPAVAKTAFPIYLMHMFLVSSVGLLIRNGNWKNGWLEPIVLLGAAVIIYGVTLAIALFMRRFIPALAPLLWGGR